MRCALHLIGAACAISFVSACDPQEPPAATALSVEQMQCDSYVAPEATQVLRSNTVLRVQPLLTHIIINPNNAEDRVCGAKILVRPPPDMSAEEMTRVLQCHGARALLGKANGADIPNDPYWLADRWVNIEVIPEDGNFAVTVHADTIRDNIDLLARARRYGQDHMLALESVPTATLSDREPQDPASASPDGPQRR